MPWSGVPHISHPNFQPRRLISDRAPGNRHLRLILAATAALALSGCCGMSMRSVMRQHSHAAASCG
jgi:hypothetical protein